MDPSDLPTAPTVPNLPKNDKPVGYLFYAVPTGPSERIEIPTQIPESTIIPSGSIIPEIPTEVPEPSLKPNIPVFKGIIDKIVGSFKNLFKGIF